MDVKINGSSVESFVYNGKHYYRVFVNSTTDLNKKVSNVPMGAATVNITWGYEKKASGSGCDNDKYYYPKNPVVTVTCDAPDLEDYKLELFYDLDGSDCFTPSQANFTLTDSITTGKSYSVTIPGTKTWSNGDSSSKYAYENVYIKVYLIDKYSDGFGVAQIGMVNLSCTEPSSTTTASNTAYMQGQ